MRIRISKKGLVAAGVAGAILVCGAVYSLVGNKSVKHVGVASVSDDNTPIADAVENALDGAKTADTKVAAAAVAGASTIEKKEVKEEKKEEAEKKDDVKEEVQSSDQTAAPAQTQTTQTKNTQTKTTQTKKSSDNTSSAKKQEVINEEVKVTEAPKPVKEAQTKTQYVEEYVGSDADTEKAIKAQQKEAEVKAVEKTGGEQFVEGLEY